MTLQSTLRAVDQQIVNHCTNGSTTGASSAAGRPAHASASPVSVPELAHELNSLLDGALRCARQVAQRLAPEPESAEGAHDLAQKLQLSISSMERMAELLERAMRSVEPDRRILESDRPLGEVVPELLKSLRPKAAEHHMRIDLHMTSHAASVTTGALGTVLQNGVMNAIEACAGSSTRPRLVEVSISVSHRSELVILISDTGPGIIERPTASRANEPAKPGGHGIGLAMCRQIIDDLGGTLSLTNIPFGAGAIFQVRVPVPRLLAA